MEAEFENSDSYPIINVKEKNNAKKIFIFLKNLFIYTSCFIDDKKKNLINFVENCFVHYALFVFDHSCSFILFSLSICLLFGSGFYFRSYEYEMYKLYSLPNTDSQMTKMKLLDTFAPERIVYVLLSCKADCLNDNTINVMKTIDNIIRNVTIDTKSVKKDEFGNNIENFDFLNKKSYPTTLSFDYLCVRDAWGDCTTASILNLYDMHDRINETTTSFFPPYSSNISFPSDFSSSPTFPTNLLIEKYNISSLNIITPLWPMVINEKTKKVYRINSIVGNMKKYHINLYNQEFVVLKNATAFAMRYELTGAEGLSTYSAALEEKIMKELNKFKTDYISISVKTERSINDELSRTASMSTGDLLRLCTAIILVLTYSVLANTTCNNKTKWWVSITGVMAAILGYIGGAGLMYLLGVSHTPPAEATPFLVLGIGVDDIFVIINAYSLTYMEESPRRRICFALKDSGLSITITTLTSIIAFVIGSISPYYSISMFCIITAASLLMGYIMCLTFFLGWLSIDATREKKQRKCFCAKAEDTKNRKIKNIIQNNENTELSNKNFKYKDDEENENNRSSLKEKGIEGREKVSYTQGLNYVFNQNNYCGNKGLQKMLNTVDFAKQTEGFSTYEIACLQLLMLEAKDMKYVENKLEPINITAEEIAINKKNKSFPFFNNFFVNVYKNKHTSTEEVMKFKKAQENEKKKKSELRINIKKKKNNRNNYFTFYNSNKNEMENYINNEHDLKSYSNYYNKNCSSEKNKINNYNINDEITQYKLNMKNSNNTKIYNKIFNHCVSDSEGIKHDITRKKETFSNMQTSFNEAFISQNNNSESRGKKKENESVFSEISFAHNNEPNSEGRFIDKIFEFCDYVNSNKEKGYNMNIINKSYDDSVSKNFCFNYNNNDKSNKEKHYNKLTIHCYGTNTAGKEKNTILPPVCVFTKAYTFPFFGLSNLSSPICNLSLLPSFFEKAENNLFYNEKQNWDEKAYLSNSQYNARNTNLMSHSFTESTSSYFDKIYVDKKSSGSSNNYFSNLNSIADKKNNDGITNLVIEPPGNVGRVYRYIFMKYYGRFLSIWWVKLIILLCFLVYIGIAIEGTKYIKSGMSLRDITPYQSFLRTFYDARETYFSDYGEEITIFFPYVEKWENKEVQQKILELHDEIDRSDYSVFVLNGFRQFIIEHQHILRDGDKTQFSQLLRKWLSESMVGRNFATHFKFDEKKNLLKSWKFYYWTPYKDNTRILYDYLSKAKGLLHSMNSYFKGEAFTPLSIMWESDPVILEYTLTNMAIALASILLVATIFIADLISTVLVLSSVLLVDLGLFGFMPMCGLELNMLTMVNLLISIGFSVDYTAHMVHTFTHCIGRSRKHRMIESLTLMGVPVTHGMISTLLPICILSTSDKYALIVFFKMMCMVMIFAYAHGVILLPVLLSLIGPMAKQKKQKEKNMLTF